MPARTTVCVLVANDMADLPAQAVRSILLRSSADEVVVGFLEECDVANIDITDRVRLVNMFETAPSWLCRTALRGYSNYGTNCFSQIVFLKWLLVRDCLMVSSDDDVIIFSDTDVVWLGDVAFDIRSGLGSRGCDFLVQTQRVNAAVNLPCAGLFGLRAGPGGMSLVNDMIASYEASLKSRSLWGRGGTGISEHYADDDTVLAQVLDSSRDVNWAELPQSAYPVGSGLAAYSRPKYSACYPPLIPPLAVHANYVVGVSAKMELLARVLRDLGRNPTTFAADTSR